MARKKKDFFKTAGNVAIGTAGLGVITGVGAGIAARAPAGTPNLTGGFNTLAGFAPIAGTAMIGGSLLKETKKLNKKSKINL